MKRFFQTLWLGVLVAVLSSVFLMLRADASEHPDKIKAISEYSYLWGEPSEGLESVRASSPERWKTVKSGEALPKKPKGITTAWIKIQLPSHIPKDYGVYIKTIYAKKLSVYVKQKLVQEVTLDYPNDQQSSLFSVSNDDSGSTVFLKMENSLERAGILSDIKLDLYINLLKTYVLTDYQNIVLGCALLSIAAILLISAVFLKKNQRTDWLLLSILLLSLGTIFITYSPFMFTNYSHFAALYSLLFDFSLAVFLPALTYYFERIFHTSKFNLIYWFRRIQMLYSLFLIAFKFTNMLTDYRFYTAYFFFSVSLLGYIMLLQFTIIIGASIILVLKGNKEAIIFSAGFASFALMSTLDLIYYYDSLQMYQFHFWKWGVLGFIIALIVILCKRFSSNHEKIINYAKELEFYNHQLQQSEKMEIISELAASVAHEVRNPMQVTRGFLQLIATRSDEKGKEYMKTAIEELDRASVIITDFLTFSKPQGDEVVELNLSKEFRQIEGIIDPLVVMHGGRISVNIADNLFIQGNSSKLKQVLINIIKNSIEAFRNDGLISISAYEMQGEVYIHIKDNGEGIEISKLGMLGKPYYTTKEKGTGIGLMVTFRIIEKMNGTIAYKSQRNIGTEVILRFPSSGIR